MIRTFHSIGQGAFYTEKFNDFTMIYDCGGSTKKIIKEKIQKTFQEGQEVDALFISHFHNDHINGLKFLLEYCNVTTVYLPLLHKYSKIQLRIENILDNMDDLFIDNLIEDPVATIREINSIKKHDTKLVLVSRWESDYDSNEDATILQSGEQIPLNQQSDDCTWVFVPYNFQNNSLSSILVDALEKAGIDTEHIASELKTKQNEIIDVYKDKLGGTKNFNDNSLVLYSGPKDDECNIRECSWDSKSLSWDGNLCACLYMGDYNVKESCKLNDLKAALIPYWDFIGTIQIPHHGSEHNFNQDLVRPNIQAIISAGKGRKHPHGETLKGICARRAHPIVVTEDPDSEIMYVLKRGY